MKHKLSIITLAILILALLAGIVGPAVAAPQAPDDYFASKTKCRATTDGTGSVVAKHCLTVKIGWRSGTLEAYVAEASHARYYYYSNYRWADKRNITIQDPGNQVNVWTQADLQKKVGGSWNTIVNDWFVYCAGVDGDLYNIYCYWNY